MLVVGLTGGIGCGKSEVRRRLDEAGLAMIDADSLARDISETNPGVVSAIKQAFDAGVYDEHDHLRRKELAEIVFSDRKKLEILNGIIHPRVISAVERRIQSLQDEGKKIAVVEAALHYEVNWNAAMDVMVVVSAPMAKRLVWLKQRDRLSDEDIKKRIASQLPLEEKVRRADYVIENTGDLKQLEEAVANLLTWLRERAK